jgi:NitT/TauT family transport system ATP-binding protein
MTRVSASIAKPDSRDGSATTLTGLQAKASAPADTKRIEIRSLSKRFGTGERAVDALTDITLDIADGEFVCLVGPSGCGKTTLLRILAGLETPTSGHARIVRKDPSKPLNSMIFQEMSIFPWMTVRNNVAYGLTLRHTPRKEIAERVDHFLALTGLDRFADAYPYQLSGGMKQRASVARAFVNDPEILLMDEPFASLDEQNKTLLQEELLRLWSQSNKTVVFITHSIDEALVLGDRVLVMTARPGTLKAEIPVTFSRPRSVYDLKADVEFGRMSRDIWHYLREEVMRGT